MKALLFHDEGEGLVSFDRPFVVWIDDRNARALRQFNPRFTPERLGYREVRRDPMLRGGIYARPGALSVPLRTAEKARQAYWSVLTRLYQRGWIHLASDDGVLWRWRDVRLGRRKELS